MGLIMCAKWKKEEYDPTILAKGLESLRKENEEGGIDYESTEDYESYTTVMHSSIEFLENIPEFEKRKIIHYSIDATAEKGKITPDTLIRNVSKKENDFLSLPLKKYVLATSLSFRCLDLLKRKIFKEGRLTFSRKLPNNFDLKPIIEIVNNQFGNRLPRNYTKVRISVDARSEMEAVDKAFDVIDLLRGIWNLYLNRGFRKTLGAPQPPVNKILFGPVHTLHRKDGSLVNKEQYWFSSEYVKPIESKDIRGNWNNIINFEKKYVRKKLKNHLYRNKIEMLLRRYSRSLDTWDLYTSFIHLWSLLEQLTSTEKVPYKETIKRTLFIFADKDYHRQILKHLKNYRNELVHAGYQTEKIETLVYQLKIYVENLFFFHISNRMGFSSVEEASEFLNLPPDINTIRTNINTSSKEILLFRKGEKFLSSMIT